MATILATTTWRR